MALTGKTIGQLTYLSGATSDTLFPVELNGDTYHVPFSGMTGNSGSSGTSGTNGTSGSSGISGSSGSSGISGSSGSSGSSGISGTNGTSGSSGTSGTSGTSGSSGTSGTSGSSGSSGTSGTSTVISGSANQILTSNGSGSTFALSGLTYDGSKLSLLYQAGDEGGELFYNKPVTNTTLSGGVTTDVYQNRFRIFEQDGTQRGLYIDISKLPNGVGAELLTKASGFVNAGDYVTLGNLRARIPTSGNRSLQVATVSGTYSVYGSGVYSQSGSIAGTTLSSPLSITTSPTYLNAGYNFGAAGATDTWILSDTVNFISWRITMVIGPSFNANLITIERLY